MKIEEVTQEYLKSVLDYNPETGIFTWKDRLDVSASCNIQFAGKKAGTIQSGNRYIIIGIRYKRYYAHRLAWLYMKGEWPPDELDHINGDKQDNRFENLRLATRGQNTVNRPVRKDSILGIKGVAPFRGKFRASIWENGASKHLGVFDTCEEAAVVYQKAAEKLHGEFAPRR